LGKIEDFNLVSSVDHLDYTIPSNFFVDPEGYNILYSVVALPSLNSATELPMYSWIQFDQVTGKLTAYSTANVESYFRIKADDQWGRISSVDFTIIYRNDPPSVLNKVSD
jgi:hypothetical protein